MQSHWDGTFSLPAPKHCTVVLSFVSQRPLVHMSQHALKGQLDRLFALDHFVSLPSLLCMVTCRCLSRHVEAHDHVSCQINVYYRSFVIRVIELIDLMSLYKCQAKTGKLRNPLLQAHRSRSPALAKPHGHAGQHGPQRSRRSLSSATALAYSTLQRLTYSLYRKSTWPPSIVKEHRNIIATAAGMIPGAGPSGALAVAAPNASSPKRAS